VLGRLYLYLTGFFVLAQTACTCTEVS
jgi:hypothetical protein